MLVFDVGADAGDKAAQLRLMGANVVCLEPQPRCAAELRRRFDGDADVSVVEQALGASPGVARLPVGDEAEVQVGTLQAAIARFGVPDFCRVDVEGFELEVLNGLDRPLNLLSFPFAKEFLDRARACLQRLQALGFTRFNVGYGETARFAFERWTDADTLVAAIDRVRQRLAWGYIYAARADVSEALLRLVEGLGRPDGEDNSLGRLRRAGVAYADVPLRLHLGCGETILPDYINIDYPRDNHNVMDVRPDFEADVVALAFPPQSVDEVRLHHVFEHFNRVVALGLLIRWQGWLKPGGRVFIETPDFLACARAALEESGPRRLGLLRHLEGDQAASWGYHVGQWYAERFVDTLSALGFGEIVTETSDTGAWHRPSLHNVTVRAVKVQTLSLSELEERAKALLWESTVSDLERPTWDVWCDQLRGFLAGEGMPGDPVAHAALAKA